MPHLARPCRTPPKLLSKESSREHQSAPCCRLQRLPYHAAPRHGVPRPSPLDHNHSPKRAAESLERLRAAVCSFNHAKPCLTTPSRTELCLTITTLQREQQRGLAPSVLPSAARTAPGPARPHHTPPSRTVPRWGLHQRLPSSVSLLQPACD